MFTNAYGEDVNGAMYNEETEYQEVQFRKRSFRINHLFFHRPLFDRDEPHTVVHETEKAILFEVPKGQFWVPKALLRRKHRYVYKDFNREYLLQGTP